MTTPGAPRTARVQRETSESSIDLSVNLDGSGLSDIETTVPFHGMSRCSIVYGAYSRTLS